MMKSSFLGLNFSKRLQKNEIGSVENLTDVLNILGEPEQGKTRFFRGHSKISYLMQPSIYRQSYLIENEDKIIRDAFTNCPDDFLPNHTLFEKLVKLQHYGYATRLLDLTANALVALYFAVSSNQNEDGELIILDIPDDEIKYDDSDTVGLLSAMSLQKYIFSVKECLDKAASIQKEQSGLNILRRLNDIFELEERKGQILDMITKSDPMNEDKLSELFKFPSISLFNDKLAESETYKIFNEQKDIVALLHTIRTDKPSFRSVINPIDLSKVLCVRAKLNNARISRQQGLFLLFGIDNSKTNPAKIPDSWQRKIGGNKIIIKNKEKILQELKLFGISKQTLFPELETQADEIMMQYKPK